VTVRLRSPGVAFLLSQLGGHSSRAWTARLAELGLEPREVMLFRHVALSEGGTQRAVAKAIGLPDSRIVAVVDSLEAKGWIERRTAPTDRRASALHVTRKGRGVLEEILKASAAHEADLTRGLSATDRRRLIELLHQVAERHGLIEGVHPGFADLRADLTQDTDADG
jgi:DNA-binding MarR family transcriptional regulator